MKKNLVLRALPLVIASLAPTGAVLAQNVNDADVSRFFGTTGKGEKKTELWGRIDLGLRYAPQNLAPAAVVTAPAVAPTAAQLTTAQDATDTKLLSLGEGSQGRFGFRGTTGPLIGGMNGIFNLEGRFNSDNGTTKTDTGSASQFFRDKSFAGLVTPYGVVTMGRQSGIGDNMVSGRYEAFGGDSYASNGTRSAAALVKLDNSIYYMSPKFSGVTVHSHYSLGEKLNTATGTAANGYGLGLDYGAGPLSASFGYQKDSLTNASTAAAPVIDRNSTVIMSGSYDLGVAKIMAVHSRSSGLNASDTGSMKVTTLGVKVPYGLGEFRASYSIRRDSQIAATSGDLKVGAVGAAKVVSFNSDQESNRLGIGYFLPLDSANKNSLNFSYVHEVQKRFFTAAGTYTRLDGTKGTGNGMEVTYRLIF